ncbi:hypothetical protein [Olivibacter sp. XZL3]|uniref:hypothetical protein n=1 Tax=Olivibacter sp. XZL3 TaxID=1735116 RepID=UPI001064BA75|nr:hypothetical protein [Olivibacter sp. XZL3]
MENQEIEIGDYVRHVDPLINGGLQMTVEGIDNEQIQCSHFVGAEATHKVSWFPKSELKLVKKAQGGFID